MVTIYFDPIEARKKGHDETLEAAQPPRQARESHPRSIRVLMVLMANKFIALAAGFVEHDRHQPKIELGL